MTQILTLDERRQVVMPGDEAHTLEFAVENWLEIGNAAILDHDFFAVALSGGSTPKKMLQILSSSDMAQRIDWSKVYLFWSDERSVPPTDPDSNYRMAMEEGGLKNLPIPLNHIFRMHAEEAIELNARAYEEKILEKLGTRPFDLVMLGMGDDGHTASLFPHTKGLHAKDALVIANHVPQKDTWRMSFTFECINAASQICVYVIGASKAKILEIVLTSDLNIDEHPSQNVGTTANPALWIIDNAAGKQFERHLNTL